MFWNIGITESNSKKLWLMVAVMLSAMLLPSIEIRTYLPRIRLDEVLIFGALACNLISWLSRLFRSSSDSGYLKGLVNREGQRRAFKTVTITFVLFLASIAISNIYAVFFLNMSFGLRDIMEWVTFAKYYLIITLAISLDLRDGEFYVLRNTFLVGFGIILLLSWMQFLNLFNANAWLTPFFAQSHLDNLVNANPPRVLGTFDNPNVMGIVSTVIMSIFVSWFYFRKSDRVNTVLLGLAIVLSIKLTFMTISRTALLATASVLTFMSIWAMFKFQWRKEVILKIGVLFVLTLTIFFTSPRDFVERMNEAADFKKSTSAQGHLMRAGSAYEFIRQSPILGWGTAKSNMTTLVDNEYALVARRYGVVGLAFYLLFFLRPAVFALRRGRAAFFSGLEFGVQEKKLLLCVAFAGASLALLVYNLTAGTFYNLQLMTLVGLFMGIIYRIEGENS